MSQEAFYPLDPVECPNCGQVIKRPVGPRTSMDYDPFFVRENGRIVGHAYESGNGGWIWECDFRPPWWVRWLRKALGPKKEPEMTQST